MPAVHAGLSEHGLCRSQLSRATLTVQGVWTEAFAALSRLPHGLALTSTQALRSLSTSCNTKMVTLQGEQFVSACREVAAAGLSGGQIYDGLIAICAREHRATLITRDRRAVSTYAALGAMFELISA